MTELIENIEQLADEALSRKQSVSGSLLTFQWGILVNLLNRAADQLRKLEELESRRQR